ncbi:MAG: hypothetical protein ABW115_19780, partial [Candidatus Thiodiazotropha sp. 6PLUC6]
TVETDVSTGHLKKLGLDDEQIRQRQQQHEAHLCSEVWFERQWRDRELLMTDKLMPEDATYKGQKVRGSDRHRDILDYRQRLREYDLKYQERPQRPDWFDEPQD